MSHKHTGSCSHEHGRVVILPRAPFRKGLGPSGLDPGLREEIESLMPAADYLVQNEILSLSNALMQANGILEGRFRATGDIDLLAWNLSAALIAWSGAEDSMALHLYQIANGKLPPLQFRSGPVAGRSWAEMVRAQIQPGIGLLPGNPFTCSVIHAVVLGKVSFDQEKMDESSKEWTGEKDYWILARPLVPGYRDEVWGNVAPRWETRGAFDKFFHDLKPWTPAGYHEP